MTTFIWIALILTAYIVGLSGLGPPEWLRRLVSGEKDKAEEDKFIADTVQRMIDEPLDVEAVYAQSQYHATNPALALALIALVISLMSISDDPVVKNVIAIGVIASLIIWGYRAIGLTLDHSQLYARAIDKYCEHLGLPPLPK